MVIPDGLSDEELELFYNLVASKYYYFIPAKAPTANWDSREPIRYGAVEYNVEDIYKDALGFATYRDRAGNETLDTMIYISDKISWLSNGLEIDMVDFGSKTVGGTYTFVVSIRNTSVKDITLMTFLIRY